MESEDSYHLFFVFNPLSVLSLFKKKQSDKDKLLLSTVKGILGKKTSNIQLYRLAISHSSVSKDSNERLEYLGDAILGAVVAEFLFMKYPYKDEGFLTEIRSRIVKRDSLNTLAQRVGLDKIMPEIYNTHNKFPPTININEGIRMMDFA